jgi:hypothetical protein
MSFLLTALWSEGEVRPLSDCGKNLELRSVLKVCWVFLPSWCSSGMNTASQESICHSHGYCCSSCHSPLPSLTVAFAFFIVSQVSAYLRVFAQSVASSWSISPHVPKALSFYFALCRRLKEHTHLSVTLSLWELSKFCPIKSNS